jgi:hypothetical protein
MQAKRIFDLAHDGGGQLAEDRAETLHGQRPHLFALCLGIDWQPGDLGGKQT